MYFFLLFLPSIISNCLLASSVRIMALYTARSRSLIIHHHHHHLLLKSKLPSLGAVINQNCWVPHFTHHHPPLSPSRPTHNHYLRNPDAIPTNDANPFLSHRFKFTQAGKRLDLIGNSTDDTRVFLTPTVLTSIWGQLSFSH